VVARRNGRRARAQVLDARDPMGTRSSLVEARMKDKTKCHKHLIFVLNKYAHAHALPLRLGLLWR
jgi:hypothetical protein